uniref:Uncharacterized protein n=1 Tax=Arundo donax TaxID=35708 RepID=A0A0A8YXW5_ARUDO
MRTLLQPNSSSRLLAIFSLSSTLQSRSNCVHAYIGRSDPPLLPYSSVCAAQQCLFSSLASTQLLAPGFSCCHRSRS